MTNNIVEIKKEKHPVLSNEYKHFIILNGNVVETLINEPEGYVKMIASEYKFYGMRKDAWVNQNVRPEDRWKY